MIGEDEDAGVIQWEAIWSQHGSPTSLSQLFVAPQCQQGKYLQFRSGKKNDEVGPE